MKGSEIIEYLRTGKRIYGTLTVSTSPMWPKVVKSLGLDFVFIDTEHIPIDRERLSWMCNLYNMIDIAPIVRIPNPDPYLATMALDGGASGIIAPYVESGEQVLELVGAVKNKPVKGKRLLEHLQNKNGFGKNLLEYIDNANANNILIVNIESRAGIAALPEILNIEGLDGVLIGPHDLSCSLGNPENYKTPEFIVAVEEIIQKTKVKGKGVGIHMIYEDLENEIRWINQGANIVLHGADLISFKVHMDKVLSKIKKSIGDDIEENELNNLNI